MSVFSERLKTAMTRRNMTQKELARKTITTEVTISRYVNGHRMLKVPAIIKIAEALDVSTDYLLGIDKSKRRRPGYTDFKDKLRTARSMIGRRYNYWGLGICIVSDICIDTETGKMMVVHKKWDNPFDTCCTPFDEFTTRVEAVLCDM